MSETTKRKQMEPDTLNNTQTEEPKSKQIKLDDTREEYEIKLEAEAIERLSKPCQQCGSSQHMLNLACKHSDSCFMQDYHQNELRTCQGYGVSKTPWCKDSDYIDCLVCLQCGQMQGTWPVALRWKPHQGSWTDPCTRKKRPITYYTINDSDDDLD